MAYYLRMGANDQPFGVWEISDTEALRIGVSNARNGPGTYFPAKPGEDIFDAIKRQADGWFGPNGESPFYKTRLEPGQYHPRMARPSDQHPHESPGFYPGLATEQEPLLKTRGQLAVFGRMLERIFQTVFPASENMAAFGHDIRNLLLLAAMEVEAQW